MSMADATWLVAALSFAAATALGGSVTRERTSAARIAVVTFKYCFVAQVTAFSAGRVSC